MVWNVLLVAFAGLGSQKCRFSFSVRSAMSLSAYLKDFLSLRNEWKGLNSKGAGLLTSVIKMRVHFKLSLDPEMFGPNMREHLYLLHPALESSINYRIIEQVSECMTLWNEMAF